MRDLANINEVLKSKPDYIGYIFYPGSKRYVGLQPDVRLFTLPAGTAKVGVFVNEKPERVIETGKTYRLNCIQLHGSEQVSDGEKIREAGFTVIKALGVDRQTDFGTLSNWQGVADYFLFDTRTNTHGGSGRKFEWAHLSTYVSAVPFFLSGGISPDDAASLRNIIHPSFFGIDINSQFEQSPGIKDADKIFTFIKQIRN